MATETLHPSPQDTPSSKTEKDAFYVSRDGDPPSKDVENGESQVFQTGVDGVDFRTVSWQRATVVFLKINFAMSILAIPGALAALGSVGGSLTIVGFTALNVCSCMPFFGLSHGRSSLLTGAFSAII